MVHHMQIVCYFAVSGYFSFLPASLAFSTWSPHCLEHFTLGNV